MSDAATLHLDGTALTCADVARAARGRIAVRLTPEARSRIAAT